MSKLSVAKRDDFVNMCIWRGDASGGSFVDYKIPASETQTVLDAVTWVQRNVEPGLSYRFACRVGMCGSCAMMVNGRPRWTCRTHVSKVIKNNQIRLEPLRNLPVIKDLVCDLSDFFAKWLKANGRFVPTATREHPVKKISPLSRQRQAANAAIECINCAVCYAACDAVEQYPNYLGPAALNRAWTLVNDVRDDGKRERLRAITADGGCQCCHSQHGCASHCPNELNPARSIAGLKQVAVTAIFKGEV